VWALSFPGGAAGAAAQCTWARLADSAPREPGCAQACAWLGRQLLCLGGFTGASVDDGARAYVHGPDRAPEEMPWTDLSMEPLVDARFAASACAGQGADGADAVFVFGGSGMEADLAELLVVQAGRGGPAVATLLKPPGQNSLASILDGGAASVGSE
jgi:hypothetical protein